MIIYVRAVSDIVLINSFYDSEMYCHFTAFDIKEYSDYLFENFWFEIFV